MFRRIVVGVDGSDAALHAVEAAAALARMSEAELHIVTVPMVETVELMGAGIVGYVPMTPLPEDEGQMEAGRQVVEKAARHADYPARTHVVRGDASTQIAALAEEVGADLIVTGRRGLGGLASALIGSTSQSIQHKAHCACLTVA